MPKTSSKQKNNKYIMTDSRLNIEANIDNKNSNDVFINIRPKFPPTLTTNDLIKNALKSDTPNKSKSRTLPNAFIAYRMELIKEYRDRNIKLPPMGQFSKIAKDSWNHKSQIVKDFYNKLAEDAKSLYKQSTIQIVLDNRMGEYVNELFSTTSTSFATTSSTIST